MTKRAAPRTARFGNFRAPSPQGQNVPWNPIDHTR
jgi:hypothetical protein